MWGIFNNVVNDYINTMISLLESVNTSIEYTLTHLQSFYDLIVS